MTSRDAQRAVGGFRERPNEVFWLEDGAYIEDDPAHRVRGGRARRPEGAPHRRLLLHDPSKEKEEYWKRYWARRARREAVKRVLVRVPFVRRLNARFGWFVAPG